VIQKLAKNVLIIDSGNINRAEEVKKFQLTSRSRAADLNVLFTRGYMMKLTVLICSVLFIHVTFVFAADEHSAMMNHEHKTEASGRMLTEAGNDAFGTIQEVIAKLNSDPNTDWNNVNIEALRQHLLDMHDMTLNVEVISQKPISNGLEAIVRPTTDRAVFALERVFKAHPAQLKRETGWDMQVVKNSGQYTLTITSENQKDTGKIRGLGYIGLMAYGNHHQPHHWAIVVGKNPHNKNY